MNEDKNAFELLKEAKKLASSRNKIEDSFSEKIKPLESVVREESSTSESINHQLDSTKKQEVPTMNYERREIKDNKKNYEVLRHSGGFYKVVRGLVYFSAATGIIALGINHLITTIQNKPVIKENIIESKTITTLEKNKEEKPQKSIHELIREVYGRD